MREKIKLDLGFTLEEPEKPPFVCDVCGQKREYWQALHRGKHSICWNHQDRKVRIPMEARVSMDWRDQGQLFVIATLIGEIKNVGR